MAKIKLEDSGLEVRLKSYTVQDEDEILDMQDKVVRGEARPSELRSIIIDRVYPELKDKLGSCADQAQLTGLTLRYSMGGPDAIKNLTGSGDGMPEKTD